MIATPAVQEKLVTGEELLAMGDIGRAELIDGRIIYMSPTGGQHGFLEVEFVAALDRFNRVRKLGWVFSGEVGIYIRRNPDRIRAADVVFVSRARLARRPRREFLNIAPELVVEIVSPSDRWDEIRQKLQDYFSIGVERVWVCEPEQQDILVYRAPDEYIRVGTDETLRGEGVLNGFELRVSELFAED
jgi:Uma2 family endonuclease